MWRWALFGIFALAAQGAAVVLGIWVIDRDWPVVIENIRPLPPHPQPGQTMRLQLDIDRRRSCASNTDRWIIDALNTRFILPSHALQGAPGPLGRSTVVLPVEVPENAHMGPARYESQVTFACNPIHKMFPIYGDRIVVPFTVN